MKHFFVLEWKMSCESCLLKRCCCCGSLRTGTLIAGAGAIVGVKYLKCFFNTKVLFFCICKILAILTIIIIALTMCGLINVQIRMIVLDSFLPELASKLHIFFNGDNLVWWYFQSRSS